MQEVHSTLNLSLILKERSVNTVSSFARAELSLNWLRNRNLHQMIVGAFNYMQYLIGIFFFHAVKIEEIFRSLLKIKMPKSTKIEKEKKSQTDRTMSLKCIRTRYV